MARHDPNRQLAALLTEADWSGGELARAVNALGTKHGLGLRYDRTSVAHWLDGSRPRDPIPELVAQALGSRIGRGVTVSDTGLARPPRAEPVRDAVLAESDPVKRLIALCHADADPASRTLLNRSLPTAATTVLPAPAPAGPDPRTPDTSGHAGRLEYMAGLFAGLTEKYGGAHARSALARYLADDTGLLLATPPDAGTRRGLLIATAHLTHLLAAMTADAELPSLGYHYYRVALELAHEAGTREPYAVALRAMSILAGRLDDHRHALEWAQAAVDVAGPTAAQATRAYLHAGRAAAHAADGQRRHALADLLTAEHHYDKASSATGPFTSYPLTALHYQRAEVHLALGDRPAAAEALEESLRTRPEGHHKALALIHAKLAETLLAMGQMEAALRHCRDFLDHYPHVTSSQARHALTDLHRSLTPYRRHPEAKEVREQVLRLARGQTRG
jgi:tetratricopeptide (TPR) repeat protein